MESIKIGIVEDDQTIRNSLVQYVGMYPALELIFAHPSVELTLKEIHDDQFGGVDIILQDIGLPGMTGLEGLPLIKKAQPKADIIMLTTYDDRERIFEALTKGARAYISKKTSLKVIIDAVFTVYRGGSYMSPSIARKLIDHISENNKKRVIHDALTERQMEIVEGLSSGLSYKMIGEQCGISIDTVRSHIKKIYRILEVNSKMEVVNIFNKSV